MTHREGFALKRYLKIAAVVGICGFVIEAGAFAGPIKILAASDSPGALSAADCGHLLHDHFVEARRISAIPTPVKRYIATGGPMAIADGGKFDKGEITFHMANPGQPYQAGDAIRDPTLPGRRLIFVAKSRNYVFLEYESGGIAHRVHAELYKLNGASGGMGKYSAPQPVLVWQTFIHQTYKNLSQVRAAVAANEIN